MNTRTEKLIESWFANTLSEADASELRQLLTNDPDADAEFAWQQSLAHAVQNKELVTGPLKIKLHDLENRFRFRRVTFQVAAIAAAFLTLFATVWLFNKNDSFFNKSPIAEAQDTMLNQNPGLIPIESAPVQDSTVAKQTSPQEASELDEKQAAEALRRQQEEQRKKRLLRDSVQKEVVANFQHFKNVSRFNNAGSVDENEIMAMNAFALYNESAEKKEPAEKQAAYKKTIKAFKPVVEADSSNMENLFYYGVALLGDKQFATAAKAFQPVTEKRSKYQIPAKFYLGMALSGAEQYKPGRKAFQDYLDAPNNNLEFKEAAEKMLKKLPPQ